MYEHVGSDVDPFGVTASLSFHLSKICIGSFKAETCAVSFLTAGLSVGNSGSGCKDLRSHVESLTGGTQVSRGRPQ